MKLYPVIVEQRNVVEAIEEMRKHLNISGREGYTYRVSFDGESRDTAQHALDVLVKSVVDEENQRRLHTAEDTQKFLDTERRRADETLKTKEAALATFLTEHPQLAVEAGGAASAGAIIRANDRDRQPTGSGAEMASLEMQKAQLSEALAASTRPGGDQGTDPLLLADVTRARSDVTAAQLNLTEKQGQFTNEHPDVKQAQRRLANAEAVMHKADAALAAWKASHPGGFGENAEKTAALRRALSAINSQIALLSNRGVSAHVDMPKTPGSVVAADTEWTRLNRDVIEARERQNQLESKQFQATQIATLASGGQGGRLLIADPAFRPLRPVAGGRFKIAVVGTAASILLALLAVLGVAALDDRLYGPRDVERVVDDQIVVVIPKLTEKGG
jgi:hypothetical protein